MLTSIDRAASVDIPARGGSLTEGEVGPARFINPILTVSQPDQDLTELVYSGLTRQLPDGSYVPDLASKYTVSTDGTIYTFTIRSNAKFQDGTPVTAEDVLFTIAATQDPNLKSPQAANWIGVTVSSPDAHTVVFTLPHAYAPFIDNTTLGILPKHLWQNVSDEEYPFNPLNTRPIGSGPYKVSSVSTDSTGSATRYDLVPFGGYTLGAPYLSKITFIFYPDDQSMEKAFNSGEIDAMAGVSPSDLSSLTRTDTSIVKTPLPRVFGVFFNQGHNVVLADASVRAALNAAVDKQAIVTTVLGGYGVTLDGPIPPGVLGDESPAIPSPFISSNTRMQQVPRHRHPTNRRSRDTARALFKRVGGVSVPPITCGKKEKKSYRSHLQRLTNPNFSRPQTPSRISGVPQASTRPCRCIRSLSSTQRSFVREITTPFSLVRSWGPNLISMRFGIHHNALIRV